MEKDFLQQMSPALKPGGVVCMRNYLRRPYCDKTGFKDITSDFETITAKEKVGVYRFEILQKI